MKSRLKPFAVAAVLSLAGGARAFADMPILYLDRGGPGKRVVGAQRLPDVKIEESRTPAGVRVITAEEIRSSGAGTLQELLSREAGVNHIDAIGNAYQGTLELRGFNATPVPATAVVVDGVRVNEADFGQVNYHLIPVEEIERIEIHPGPSTMYGRNAMAGLIHITTKRGGGERVSAETGASYGSTNRRRGWAWVQGSASGVDYRFWGVKERDNGHRTQADADIASFGVKLGYKPGEDSDISVSYSRTDDRMQQPGSLTGEELAEDPEQHVSEVDTVSKADFFVYNHRQAFPFGLTGALNVHLRQRHEATPKNKGRTSRSESLSEMRTRGITAQLSRESELLERRVVPTVGVEYVRSEADTLSEGTFGGWPFRSGSLAEDDSAAVFAQGVVDLVPESLVLTAGLRHDRARIRYQDKYTPANGGSQSFDRTSPRVGLNLNPSEELGLYASYSESFRTPTVNEISSLGPFSQSRLDPVRARSYEVGARKGFGDDASLRLSAYRTDVRDEIYFDPTQGNFGENINVEKTRRMGLEWEARARRGMVEAFLNHAFTEATFQSELALSKPPWPGTQRVEKGDVLPMVPAHSGAFGLTLRPREGLALSLDEACASPRRIVGDESNTEPKLPGYCVTNLGASYETSSWRVFVRGFNVLDSDHQARGILSTNPGTGDMDRFLVPAAGVSVRAGISYRFSTGGGGTATARRGRDIVETARKAVREFKPM